MYTFGAHFHKDTKKTSSMQCATMLILYNNTSVTEYQLPVKIQNIEAMKLHVVKVSRTRMLVNWAVPTQVFNHG